LSLFSIASRPRKTPTSATGLGGLKLCAGITTQIIMGNHKEASKRPLCGFYGGIPRMSVDGDHGLAFRAGTKLFYSIQTLPSYVPMFKRCKAVLRTPLDAITSGARASFGCSHAQTNR